MYFIQIWSNIKNNTTPRINVMSPAMKIGMLHQRIQPLRDLTANNASNTSKAKGRNGIYGSPMLNFCSAGCQSSPSNLPLLGGMGGDGCLIMIAVSGSSTEISSNRLCSSAES